MICMHNIRPTVALLINEDTRDNVGRRRNGSCYYLLLMETAKIRIDGWVGEDLKHR